jgi:hypothetical protein
MKMPRYRVATCEGYVIRPPFVAGTSGHPKPGLSATICDTLYGWREVTTYRSEDRGPWPERGGYSGRAHAELDAEEHAAYLNRLHATALHRNAVRAARAAARARG